MRDQEVNSEFSWTSLFLVTGISFLGFCMLLQLLEHHYPALFFKTGLISLAVGCIIGVFTLLINPKTESN
jgi:hypothetical protein